MERSQKLKILYKEAKILFEEGIDEATTYDRLSSKKLFGETIQFDDIQDLYRKFQEDVDLEKKAIEAKKKQENLDKECTRLSNELGRLRIQLKQATNEHRDLGAKRVCLTSEYYELKPYRQNAKKHLIYNGTIMNFDAESSIFWQERYALDFSCAAVDINHTFRLFDLYHQTSEQISIPLIGRFIEFYALIGKFVLVTEHDVHEHNVCYLSLMKFDPGAEAMQLVQRIEYQSYCINVYVDSADPKKFITMQYLGDDRQYFTQICTLVDGQIRIEKEIVCQHNNVSSYFNGQLLSITPRNYDGYRHVFDTENTSIEVFNLDQGTSKSLRMKSFPENVKLRTVYTEYGLIYNYAWVRNRFFHSIEFKMSGNFGCVFADSETCEWVVLDTAFKLPIQSIQFVNGSDLMVHTEKDRLTKIYKIPIRKPDRLRCMAWRKLIEVIRKTTNEDDLYQEARRCLPLNTDVQPFRFIDVLIIDEELAQLEEKMWEEADLYPTCSSNMFNCTPTPWDNRVKTLPWMRRCDGVKNCWDGSDEKLCTSNGTCADDEFACPQDNSYNKKDKSKCFPKSFYCNGEQYCSGLSGEAGCDECGGYARQCSYYHHDVKKCVPIQKICDGKWDCLDLRDENFFHCNNTLNECPGQCHINTTGMGMFSKDVYDIKIRIDKLSSKGRDEDEYKRWYSPIVGCSGESPACDGQCKGCMPNAFFCKDEMKCVSSVKVCNGVNDCLNGLDEKNCTKILACGAEENRCNVCNCLDNCQDEKNFSDCKEDFVIEEKDVDHFLKYFPEFVNRSSAMSWLGYEAHGFYCSEEKMCISLNKRCDGRDDCLNGDDEEGCECFECTMHPHQTYVCREGKRCFRFDEVCNENFESRCPNATLLDEQHCELLKMKSDKLNLN